MGSLLSRTELEQDDIEQQADNTEIDNNLEHDNAFGTQFLIGGQRIFTQDTESFILRALRGERNLQQMFRPPRVHTVLSVLCPFNLHRDSLKLHRTIDETQSTSPTAFLYTLHFRFDSLEDCQIKVFLVSEVADVNACRYEPLSENSVFTQQFQKGFGQFFELPIDFSNYDKDFLFYTPTRSVWPVIICIEPINKADTTKSGTDEPIKERKIESHSTFATLLHCDDGTYEIKPLQVRFKTRDDVLVEQELYGTVHTDHESEVGKECVICISETRNTVVLPCRHLCLCSSCADVFRFQTNKCPICRSNVKSLVKIKANAEDKKTETKAEIALVNFRNNDIDGPHLTLCM
eukprot:TRINITY_DN2548_c0_g1_i1.p1 TRINITY_DN2548_c0_g1~~TRINITY_DN2548_c0_g1_i1.p1  ORF type:complete len:348 (-),score=55.15 TRINITY_DN2548_c0_g1_i1:116-1159(-)